jgi:hypothetical protein
MDELEAVERDLILRIKLLEQRQATLAQKSPVEEPPRTQLAFRHP